MTGESVLAAPEKMETARLRASLADVFFAKFNSAGEMKRFFRWFFYRPRVVCAWCNKRLAWGGVFSPSWKVSHGICAGCGRYYPSNGRGHVSPH